MKTIITTIKSNKKAMMTGHSYLQKAIHEDFLNLFFPQRKLAVPKLT